MWGIARRSGAHARTIRAPASPRVVVFAGEDPWARIQSPSPPAPPSSPARPAGPAPTARRPAPWLRPATLRQERPLRQGCWRHAAEPGRMVGHAQADGPVVGGRLCPEHGRGAGLLHAVFDGALAAHRDFRGRHGVWRGRRARRDRRAIALPDGRGWRGRGAGPAGERAQASRRRGRHRAGRGVAVRGRHVGFRRTAGRAGPHLACTVSLAREWLAEPDPRAPALVRHDPGGGIPAHRVAGGQRRAVAHGALAGAGLWRLVRRGLGDQRPRRLRAGGGHLRPDLQDHAARARGMEGCVDRRAVHGRALHPGEVDHRLLPGAQRRGLGLRRGRLAGGGSPVGVLLGADFPDRRGVHLGFCEHVRFTMPGLPHRCARRQRTSPRSRGRSQSR